ncbi:MAG: hypothetical protein AB3N18_04240 [Allomuricauda sp.]
MNKKLKKLWFKLVGRQQYPTSPVCWRFKSKRTSFNTYRVHITALIVHPYRLYAFTQESILKGYQTTTIAFEKSTFVHIYGGLKEKGNPKTIHNKGLDKPMYYYNTIVDYIQDFYVFTTPEKIKGVIHYTPCTEKRCLANMTEDFTVIVD